MEALWSPRPFAIASCLGQGIKKCNHPMFEIWARKLRKRRPDWAVAITRFVAPFTEKNMACWNDTAATGAESPLKKPRWEKRTMFHWRQDKGEVWEPPVGRGFRGIEGGGGIPKLPPGIFFGDSWISYSLQRKATREGGTISEST